VIELHCKHTQDIIHVAKAVVHSIILQHTRAALARTPWYPGIVYS
jgi:hypothetical protein